MENKRKNEEGKLTRRDKEWNDGETLQGKEKEDVEGGKKKNKKIRMENS